MMNERMMNETVRDWLRVNRPAAVPESVAIVGAQDKEPEVRPYFLVSVSEGNPLHRKWRVYELKLVLRYRVDEEGADGAVPGYMGELVCLLERAGKPKDAADEALRESLEDALKAVGGWLRVLRKRGGEKDLEDGDRSRRVEWSWRVDVQTGVP